MFAPKGSINNIQALVQIMAWRRPGDKPLSEPMLANFLTHICVTRPQWVKGMIDVLHFMLPVLYSIYSFIYHLSIFCKYVRQQCAAVIRDQCSPKSPLKAPHSAPIRTKYGMSSVDSNSDLYSTPVTEMLLKQYYVILDSAIPVLGCESFHKNPIKSNSNWRQCNIYICFVPVPLWHAIIK